MTIDDELRSVIERVMDEEIVTTDGEHFFPRDDDVLFAEYLERKIGSVKNPCVFSDDTFWSYQDSGIWEQHDAAWMRRQVMQLSGARIFKKKTKTAEVTEDGKPIWQIETKALNLWSGKIRSIIECLQTLLFRPDYFSKPSYGIAFKNGFVEVTKDARVHAPSPQHRARYIMPYAYRDHPCPRWHGFLRDVFLGDPDAEQKTRVLQEFLGAALVGSAATYEKSLILLGHGSNGKSVLLNVIQKLFPEQAISSVAPQQFEHEYYRARLYGSVLNVVSEMPRRDLVDTPAFNAIVSGDRIDARRPAGHPFEFRPRAAHMFAVNPPLPSTAEMSRGFWRRFIILSFNRSFENDPAARDKAVLQRELEAEMPGIAYWCIEGAKRLHAQARYSAVDSSDRHLQQWRETADQVALFVRSQCQPISLDAISPAERDRRLASALDSEELYESYRKWAERTGHSKPMTLIRFVERLDLLGHRPVDLDGDGRRLVRPLAISKTQVDRARNVEHSDLFGWKPN